MIATLSSGKSNTMVSARRRGAAMVATLLIHLVLLLMVLSARGKPPPPVAADPLVVFDVVPPSPIVDEPVPPPPPAKSQKTVSGGLVGQSRTSPRRSTIIAPTPPRRANPFAEELPNVTPDGRVPLADPIALPDMVAGSGGGLEQGGAEGRGHGRGSGTGGGDGQPSLARALWIRMPSVRELEFYWPARARRERIAGRAILACIVPRPGPPRRCSVVSEHPEGIGFGRSAVQMSHLFRIKPVTRGSENQNLPIIVPVSFGVPITINLPATAK